MVKMERIGGLAYRYLSAQPGDGRVVSTFFMGVNVLFEENSDPRFVVFQTELTPLHPWAIQLEISPISSPGEVCRVEADTIHFAPLFTTSLADVDVRDLCLESWTEDEARRAQGRIPWVSESVRALHEIGAFYMFGLETDEHRRRARDEEVKDLALEIIGLGGGSTPSGDDFIVGQLAVLWAVLAISPRADRQIGGFQKAFQWNVLRKKTPLPSAQMVMAAAFGRFPEPVIRFMSAIARGPDDELVPPLIELTSLGGSSGMETLTGILQALEDLDLGSESSEGHRDRHGL